MERASFTSAAFSISVFNPSCRYFLRWIVGRSDKGLTVNESTVCLWSDSTSIMRTVYFLRCARLSVSADESKRRASSEKSPVVFAHLLSTRSLGDWNKLRNDRTPQESVWALLLLIPIGQEIFSAQSDAENSHSKGKCPLNIPSPISAPSCSKMYLLTSNVRCRNLHTHFTLKKYSASQSNESFFALVFP